MYVSGGMTLSKLRAEDFAYTNGLLLELTEKQTLKYLMMSDNDFGKIIDDFIIVTNNRLKIENVNNLSSF